MIHGSLAARLRSYAHLSALPMSERFEQAAHRFLIETGLIAPGKPAPGEDLGQQGERTKRWTAWQREEAAQFRDDLLGAAEALEALSA